MTGNFNPKVSSGFEAIENCPNGILHAFCSSISVGITVESQVLLHHREFLLQPNKFLLLNQS